VAFLKNRSSYYIIGGIIVLAFIGLFSQLFSNPAGFFKGIAVMLVFSAVIFFLLRRFTKLSPAKSEQRAFVKAAKRSLKRHNQKESGQNTRKNKPNNLTSIKKLRANRNKKQSNPQLTVIEGKKGKKKNRASFF
jgi:Na+/melibiose symporter-like transporter